MMAQFFSEHRKVLQATRPLALGLVRIGQDWIGLDGIRGDEMRLDEIGWDWMGLDKIGQDRIRLECSRWPLCVGLVSNVGNLAIKRETISKILFPFPVLENGLQKALELDIGFVHSGYLLYSLIHTASNVYDARLGRIPLSLLFLFSSFLN